MAISPIQTSLNQPSKKPYLEANGKINTDNNTKPLKPEGHLVLDRLHMMPKFFLKDLAYDFKAVRDGFRGTANDHQAGRFNDTGLKLGGIGIAAMLAARTTNPLARIMEYAGLGAFLFAMSVYPKIAIQAPSRALHGFDSGIEYIDDQGRKKSMFQDQNYIPFDMYRGETPSTDLDIIGDRMGIPRDIQNRHGIIKEQMRKIAIQNNTLWMLTAGFATPIIAALTCCGLEKVIGSGLEKIRNMHFNSEIAHALTKTQNMSLDIDKIDANKLSQKVEKLLSNYTNKELPKEEYNKLVSLFTENLDSTASSGIKDDLAKIFSQNGNSYVIDEKATENILSAIKRNIPHQHKNSLEKIFMPSSAEINNIIKNIGATDNKTLSSEQLAKFKEELKKLYKQKYASEKSIPLNTLKAYQNRIIESVSKSIKSTPSTKITGTNVDEIINFAKIIGEFKSNDKVLDKCKSFKFEYAPETVMARAYADFEKTLFKSLDISFRDLRQMKDSDIYTKEILEKKIETLVNDKSKYEKTVKKLGKVISDMEIKLNGDSSEKSRIKDLITAIENNYNNTAKRLNALGADKYKNTINKLVKEDVSTLSNSINTRQELFELLDGTAKNKFEEFNYWGVNLEEKIKYAKENAKGIGSSKNQEISRIIDRYQGSKNSMYRMMHTLDIYGRKIPESKYEQEILKKGKEALLSADTTQFTLKNGTMNNPEFYKDMMNSIWDGKISDAAKKGLEDSNTVNKGAVLERFEKYINRFREIIGNNDIDFTKPNHKLDPNSLNKYTKSSKTRMAKFNLVAQSPIDFAKKAAQRRYGNQMWLRIASTIGGAVLAGTLITQFAFGKIKNPHNLKKQVSDDTNI